MYVSYAASLRLHKGNRKVSLLDVFGASISFQLGKVLPGQRARSQRWYEDLGVLCSELQMTLCEE